MSQFPHYKERFNAVLLLGAPGSGKGTLGKAIASSAGCIHISSGDIFRGLSPDSPAGELFHAYAGKGALVPDEATVAIWHQYIQGLIATNRYFPQEQLLILDGIPRTYAQTVLLDPYVNMRAILVLEMSNKHALFERLKKRAKIEGRSDDIDEAVLLKRMDVYQKETVRLLDHYPKEIVHHIQADAPPPIVLRDALKALTALFL